MLLETFVVVNVLMLVNKMIYTKITDHHATYSKIINEGLYHVTTRENAESILKDGYLNPSNHLLSLGKEKTFFFAGVPSYMDLCTNVASAANQYEMTAIKIKLTPEELSKFKQRTYNDKSIIYEGKCLIPKDRTSIVDLVLDLDEKKEVKIREKKENENYVPTPDLKNKLSLKQGLGQNMKKLAHSYINELKLLKSSLTSLTIHSYDILNKYIKQSKYKIDKTKQFNSNIIMEEEISKQM